jgi:hypothetical protein
MQHIAERSEAFVKRLYKCVLLVAMSAIAGVTGPISFADESHSSMDASHSPGASISPSPTDRAHSDRFKMSDVVIGVGINSSRGGRYAMQGHIGQPVETMSAAPYRLASGLEPASIAPAAHAEERQ